MNDYFIKNIIALQSVFGAGSKRSFQIVSELFEKNLLGEPVELICQKINYSEVMYKKIISADYDNAEKIIKTCNQNGIKIVSYFDAEYPELLKNIDSPPIALFVKGVLPDFDLLPSVTVVGPREPSEFGKKAAFSLGFRFARAGMIVVSGGALGCDTAVHKGALAAEGTTVAVLGCGIESNYLSENKPLRDKIVQSGCLVSEYPPPVNATKYSFPVRNRILSGLTLGTVVVEAGEKSGALNTAGHATEQGRDVFVIPGNPTQKEYKGSNKLLRDGAKPLLDAMDVFGEYILKYPDLLNVEKAYKSTVSKENSQKVKKNAKISLSKEAQVVYNYIDKHNFTSDDLLGCGLETDEILSALTELELEDLITPLPGSAYQIN